MFSGQWSLVNSSYNAKVTGITGPAESSELIWQWLIHQSSSGINPGTVMALFVYTALHYIVQLDGTCFSSS